MTSVDLLNPERGNVRLVFCFDSIVGNKTQKYARIAMHSRREGGGKEEKTDLLRKNTSSTKKIYKAGGKEGWYYK